MFSESEVENLHKHKLWHDLCLYLQEHAETSTNDTVTSYYKYVLPNETNIHHYTFCRTTLVLSNLLQPEESQTLINNAAEAIQKNEYISEEKQRTLLKLKIRHHENRIYLKQEEGTENFIYEVKNTKMDKETANLYFRMCYKYYEAKSDFEECHKYFEKYLSDVNMNEQAQEPARYDSQIMHKQYKSLYTSDNKALSYKLVKYTLHNPKTFNFTGVTLHKIYQFLDDESLKMLFENVMIGNVEYVLENKDTIEKILPSHYNLIKEKVYLMSFINLCFYNKERILTIDEIKQHLNVERGYVFYVLMKAFGMKLVKGVIDGEKDIVKYSFVIPRILNSDEIVVLRSKYENWADRIGTMIKLAK